MTAVMILQARMTSTRLPGKVLMPVAGRTILEWVVRASERVPGIDVVCVAVPEGEVHDPVADEARRLGAAVARGPELDVLERFRMAAAATGADEVMRVTTDCPLMDPVLCGEVLALRREAKVDYACNNEPFGYPHGLDCEAFTAEVLERAAANAIDPYDREHVTPWIKRDPGVSRAYLEGPGGERARWRWTVDHADDVRFFTAVAEALGEGCNDSAQVIELIEGRPELLELNRAHWQR